MGAAAAISVASAPASAAPVITLASTARAHAEAETNRKQAERLLRTRQIDAACETFAESYEKWPRLSTRISLARCHAAQGRYVLAHDELEEIAALAEERRDKRTAATAKTAAQAAEKQT